MTPTDRNSVPARRGDGHVFHQLAGAVRKAVRSMADVIEECNYAQRRMLQVRTNPERYVIHSDQAPDTFAEFLFRTSGLLIHEPAADKRFADWHTRR
jgi:hypothetical protein